MTLHSNKIVELNNIYLKSDRGSLVFEDLSFSLTAGRTAVISGGPGSGKSLLVELILGLRKAESGSVELFGNLIKSGSNRTVRKARSMIGGVGGRYSLIPAYTVAENICYPMTLAGDKTRKVKERLLAMLTEFSLLKQVGEYPENLTRVENTLVQLARASIANQPLMIIDEPLAGLDQITLKRVTQYLVKVSLSGRSMIILTSEQWSPDLPNTDIYRIDKGALA